MVEKQRHGLGIMIHDNGRVYEGNWEKDFKTGKGYEEYPSGNRYWGDYLEGKPHGVGHYYWHNG
jgi:hypothetical protein